MCRLSVKLKNQHALNLYMICRIKFGLNLNDSKQFPMYLKKFLPELLLQTSIVHLVNYYTSFE